MLLGLCDDVPVAQMEIAGPAGVTYPLLVESSPMPPPFDSVEAFPMFLLIDRDGTILEPVIGRELFIRRAVERALAAKGP